MVNQNTAPGSRLPSPVSVSSRPIDLSGVPAGNKVELAGAISSLGTMMSAGISIWKEILYVTTHYVLVPIIES